ncbi:hypothetical protein D9758_006580 [Tetrapyrgos nigripes]|uniref:Uncharacterized protein n=1 Tax=Tetrapyrgos nigripes TaxID=182062 RepID=A0A8H5LRE3_9AGAR|nr:hypothetical protein D9758_006580 [Tetrapyrgos nigripes]
MDLKNCFAKIFTDGIVQKLTKAVIPVVNGNDTSTSTSVTSIVSPTLLPSLRHLEISLGLRSGSVDKYGLHKILECERSFPNPDLFIMVSSRRRCNPNVIDDVILERIKLQLKQLCILNCADGSPEDIFKLCGNLEYLELEIGCEALEGWDSDEEFDEMGHQKLRSFTLHIDSLEHPAIAMPDYIAVDWNGCK